ncbi:unnamed protein product [Ectocarpus sp. 12 AP-2014]
MDGKHCLSVGAHEVECPNPGNPGDCNSSRTQLVRISSLVTVQRSATIAKTDVAQHNKCVAQRIFAPQYNRRVHLAELRRPNLLYCARNTEGKGACHLMAAIAAAAVFTSWSPASLGAHCDRADMTSEMLGPTNWHCK